MQLSEHLTKEEFEFSETAARLGIKNSMTPAQVCAATDFAEKCFEPIRAILGGKPIRVNSGFRSEALNRVLPNASKTSQHMQANAVDISPKGSLPENFKKLVESELEFDQLFIEGITAANPQGSWIHCSFNTESFAQRMQIKIVEFADYDGDGDVEPKYRSVSKEEALAWCEENQ